MPPLTRVEFVSQRSAEERPGDPRAALVSITDEAGAPASLQAGWAAVLRLAFYDVEPAWARPGQALFSEAQARALWKFVYGLPRQVDTLHVHCRSGISRSGAVARAITERLGLPFDGEEKECNAHVLALLRAAHPAARGP
jgi:predicted protein tyrosine phosphatase